MVEQVNTSVDNSEFDLAIIGGGIIGMCTAWYASQKFPQWRTAVFEQNTVGSGASHYSASLNLPYGHTQLRYQLASRSNKLYDELKKAMSLPIKDICFYGITTAENSAAIIANFIDGVLQNTLIEIHTISSKYSDLVISDDKTIVVHGTANYAMENNVAKIIGEHFSNQQHFIFEHTSVQSIELLNEQYRIRTATGLNFITKRVVQATGPWLSNLGMNEQQLPNVRVKKIVAFHIMQQPNPDDALLYFFDDDAFLLPKYEAGYWLFSFRCDHWDVLPDSSKLHINEDDKTKARSILKKYYPSFERLCNDGRVFCDAYTNTGDPVIETLYNGNYVFAGAGAGSGYRLAPAIAEQAISRLETLM
jgi:glycine/D-amino acid oxidase-like deaminating enzyme